MRAVVQRVRSASVTVDGEVAGAIGPGVLVYLGVAVDDAPADSAYIVGKVRDLRIFEDEAGKMNRSMVEAGGAVLSCRSSRCRAMCAAGGDRPSIDAAAPERARPLYEAVATALRASGVQVETGVFQAHMLVSSVNDGPVTILLDSKKRF